MPVKLFKLTVRIASECVRAASALSIGDRSVIGAGSVVTKDIPVGVLAVGNPCRVIREIEE